MTLDELVITAYAAQHDLGGVVFVGKDTLVPMKAAVLAVLDAVERECVPDERGPARLKDDAREEGWSDCRNEMLDALDAMRGNDEG